MRIAGVPGEGSRWRSVGHCVCLLFDVCVSVFRGKDRSVKQ